MDKQRKWLAHRWARQTFSSLFFYHIARAYLLNSTEDILHVFPGAQYFSTLSVFPLPRDKSPQILPRSAAQSSRQEAGTGAPGPGLAELTWSRRRSCSLPPLCTRVLSDCFCTSGGRRPFPCCCQLLRFQKLLPRGPSVSKASSACQPSHKWTLTSGL